MSDWKVVRRLALAVTMVVTTGCGSTTNVGTTPTPIPAPQDKGVVSCEEAHGTRREP